ncbi:NB-ARC domains-containing protein [Tanacetum coccineum]
MLKELNFSYCNLEQVPESIGGLSCLKKLNLDGNNLLEVPESIGGLSCLEDLYLSGNNFTGLPGSLSQLSHLQTLDVDGCKKLEVLPELPHSIETINASDCTSLREVSRSSKDPLSSINYFFNCPNLFKNVTIDSEGSVSKTKCLDSSTTSQGFIHQLSAFLGYLGLQTNRCGFFLQDHPYSGLDIFYHGNSMPEWFTSRSTENHVKVELPLDWCYDKFWRYGFCAVFKCKNPFNTFKGMSIKNFDGASIAQNYFPGDFKNFLKREVIGTQDSYMIRLHYKRMDRRDWGWEEAKNFVTFSFLENNEDFEVKECGVRLICDEDIQQEADSSMLQGLPTPTQHGGMLDLTHDGVVSILGASWSW